MSILNLSQYATEDVGTECDTGKTKITCYYGASLKHDLTCGSGACLAWDGVHFLSSFQIV